jgi:hypothetical protein
MSSFHTRLAAIGYPKAGSFDPSEACDALALYVHLEDKHIRQLPIEERGPLRRHEVAAVRAYMQECQAPASVLAHLDAGRHRPVCSWLLCLALQYEYSDGREAYEAAYSTAMASSPPSAASSMIAPDDPELLRLAEALKVAAGPDATGTLQEVAKAARKVPRRAAPPPTETSSSCPNPATPSRQAARPPVKLGAGMCSTHAACCHHCHRHFCICRHRCRRCRRCTTRRRSRRRATAATAAPAAAATPLPPPPPCHCLDDLPPPQPPSPDAGALSGLSEGTFPLGFTLGMPELDDAARVLRMLHVKHLRALQVYRHA